MTVGLEGAHAELLGQGQGLLVVGFGLFGIGRIGVGLDNAKLVQRERLVGMLFMLPGQVERPARVLPGLLAASRKTTHLAELPPRTARRAPGRRLTLVASSNSARPSARRPWSA